MMKTRFKFKRKIKMITVLELSSDWLKIVQVQPWAKASKVNRIIVEEVANSGDSQDEKISGQIKNLFKNLKIDPDMLIVVVPHQVAVVRNLEFPSTNPDEIKNMVELQIGKQTPFAVDEIIYDYAILDINTEGYSRVMLAIVHQNITNRYFKILKAAELRMERVVLSSEGLLAWYRFAHKEKADDKPYVLIDMDCGKSNFTVILKNKLIFCRNISVGKLESLNEMEEWQEKLVKEIKHSIYAYQNEMAGKEIDKIIITGAQAFTELLNKTVLKDKIGLAIEIIPQFENIPEVLSSLAQSSAAIKNISVAPLLGFALTPDKQKINLIPLRLRLEKEMRGRGKDLYLFGICLAFILMTVSSIFLGKTYNKKQYLDRLKKETFKIQEKAGKLESMLNEIGGIKERVVQKDFTLNFIYEIHKTIFPEIYLTSISSTGENRLILRGVSSLMSEVFEFLSVLEKSECFQNVKTKFVTTRKIGNKELTEFEIMCSLEEGFKKKQVENK